MADLDPPEAPQEAKTRSQSQRRARIVASRLRLMRRFLGATQAEGPDTASKRPQHTSFALPPGQHETKKWPLLDLGERPRLDPEAHTLVVDGAVRYPLALRLEALRGPDWEQVEERQDFHCVTGWSRLGLRFRGLRLLELVAASAPKDAATQLLIHGADGFSASLALEDALRPSNLVVWSVDGAPLTPAHGGPLRLVTPGLYAWKGVKWLSRLELLDEERLGFWEAKGYARRGDPALQERYADPEHPPPGAELP